ncbi:MAG: transposase [Candidatus Methylomirabilia bacterium]
MAKIDRMPTPAKEVVPMSDGRGAAGQAVLADSTALSSRPAPSVRPAAGVPDPEVPEKAARRRFPAEYKLRILRDAEGCGTPGAIGALLRREGLYSSHLTTWRQQQEQGVLEALSPRTRGRRAAASQPLVRRIAELERELARLHERLEAWARPSLFSPNPRSCSHS